MAADVSRRQRVSYQRVTWSRIDGGQQDSELLCCQRIIDVRSLQHERQRYQYRRCGGCGSNCGSGFGGFGRANIGQLAGRIDAERKCNLRFSYGWHGDRPRPFAGRINNGVRAGERGIWRQFDLYSNTFGFSTERRRECDT